MKTVAEGDSVDKRICGAAVMDTKSQRLRRQEELISGLLLYVDVIFKILIAELQQRGRVRNLLMLLRLVVEIPMLPRVMHLFPPYNLSFVIPKNQSAQLV